MFAMKEYLEETRDEIFFYSRRLMDCICSLKPVHIAAFR